MTSFYSRDELDGIGFAEVGQEVFISRKASIYGAENMRIGNHVRIDDFTVLSGKITIGDYVHIAVFTSLFGGNAGIDIGDFANLSSRIAVYALTDDYSGEFMTNPMVMEKYKNTIEHGVTIGKHVIIATGVTVLPGVTLGEGSAVGAMSLVKENVEPWAIAAGIPARRIKARSIRLLKLERQFLKEENRRMSLKEKFEEIFEILKDNRKKEEKEAYFLKGLRKDAERIKTSKKIILCGATPFAKNVLQNRGLLFSDDVSITIEDFGQEQVTIPQDGFFILCSRPNINKHLKYLENIEEENIASYQLLLALEPRYSVNPHAYQHEKIIEQVRDIIGHANDYYKIYLNLRDQKSKDIFMRMVLFRLTYDYTMNYGNASEYSQYFDKDIISLGQEEIFVDCGGYLGDTLEDFKSVTQNHFKKYYYFEPDKKLFDVARKARDERVVYINKGVWESVTTLYFKEETSAGNGMMVGKENQQGVIEVPVTSLDTDVAEVTFIKMDVEGSELMALKGAQNLIRKWKPKLAICIYHKYEDARVLYDYINSFGEYDIYLRAERDSVDIELYYLCIPRK